MKRFHVHVAVQDLAESTLFYSKLFGQPPAREQADYVKWMLEDPRVNFAISSRGHSAGVNHFGIQVDSHEELQRLKSHAEDALGGVTLDQDEAACCYAKSEKHWIVDPQGLAWEHFVTTSEISAFGNDTDAVEGAACCIPLRSSQAASEDSAPCCIPRRDGDGKSDCCG